MSACVVCGRRRQDVALRCRECVAHAAGHAEGRAEAIAEVAAWLRVDPRWHIRDSRLIASIADALEAGDPGRGRGDEEGGRTMSGNEHDVTRCPVCHWPFAATTGVCVQDGCSQRTPITGAEATAAIVAWMRDGGSAQALCLADAIERGEHLKDDQT